MNTPTRRRKAIAVVVSASAWASLLGCCVAVGVFLQDGPFAGRGDHSDMTMAVARIAMIHAEAPAVVPDPFVVE